MSLSLCQARRILGSLAKNASDEEIIKDIEAAELLKNLFFDQLVSLHPLRAVGAGTESPNVP